MRVTIENGCVYVTDESGNEFYQYDQEGEAMHGYDDELVKRELGRAVEAVRELPIMEHYGLWDRLLDAVEGPHERDHIALCRSRITGENESRCNCRDNYESGE